MNDVTNASGQTKLSIAGAELEIVDRGQGAPLLFLHGAQGIAPAERFLGLVAANRRVIAPSHPGFGKSSLPDWLDSIEDISHIYLELLDRMKIQTMDVIGCSVGGWIAADMATKTPERIRRLMLVGPVGVKTGPVDKLDVPDVFAMAQDKLDALLYHNIKSAPDFTSMSEQQLQGIARNREALALLAWEPYMHNPKLKYRLHRVNAPALFVRGASDGLVSAQYLAGYAALVPNAKIATIAEAGHAPQVEQPEALAKIATDFFKN